MGISLHVYSKRLNVISRLLELCLWSFARWEIASEYESLVGSVGKVDRSQLDRSCLPGLLKRFELKPTGSLARSCTFGAHIVQPFGAAMVRTCLLMLPNVHDDRTDYGYHDWNFDSWSVYERLDVCISNIRVTHVLMIRSQWSCLHRNTLH